MSAPAESRPALAKVRHDMRTPINHILGYSELLAEDADALQPDELVSDLGKIQTAARNLLDMIGEHLSDEGFERLADGRVPATAAIAEKNPPARAAIASAASSPDGEDEPDEPLRVTGRILVVDDNPENCATLSRRLVKQGHTVTTAFDGETALERLRGEAFDLVLLDILMPGIDGYTVLKTIKADEQLRHVPVIMISALDEIESVVHCIESGAEDYLPKPFNPTLLRARIGASLEKKSLRDDEQRHLRVIEETQQRLTHELDEAARYVRSIIPDPIREPVEIDWQYIPSTELGGDAFGYHRIDKTHLAIYLLDVCGHGVGASLLSVTAMNVIRAGSLPGADFREPSQVLSALNEAFPMERQNNMYFTIWYGVFDLEARTLRYASGGHPPALLITSDAIRPLRTPGLIIGAMEGIDFPCESVDVPAGSRLLVFSDGVYEISCPDGSMIEFADFEKYVAGWAQQDGRLESLASWAVDRHGSSPLEDDYSLVQIRF